MSNCIMMTEGQVGSNGMNKRKLHHIWTKLRPVRQSYLVVALIITILVAVTALRQNNLTMIRLRTAVTQADEKGQGTEEALEALRRHVYSHMNSDLTAGGNAIRPPVQLTKTYERLVSVERDRVAAINKKVADDAVAICEQKFPVGQLRDGRVPCVQEYMTKNSVSENKIVAKELYQFDFVSPVWSPDLAGWSLVLSAVLFMLLVLRFSLERWLKHQFD